MERFGNEDVANICQVLACQPESVTCLEVLAGGLTNTSWKIDVDGTIYVYRRAGAGTDEIINRTSEAYAQGVARELGVDRTFIFEDAEQGWKLSRFIEDCIPFDYHNEAHVSQAMELARKLHTSGATSPWDFNVYQKALEIVDLIEGVEFEGLDARIECAAELAQDVQSDEVPRVLCHNDFYEPNFLVHEKGMDLIDWEYSAMSDYASDLGTFICCSDYGIPEAEAVIAKYFQREPTLEEMRHCMAYVGLCGFYWFVWAIYKDKCGDPVGEWLDLWYRMAVDFGEHARALYREGAQKS